MCARAKACAAMRVLSVEPSSTRRISQPCGSLDLVAVPFAFLRRGPSVCSDMALSVFSEDPYSVSKWVIASSNMPDSLSSSLNAGTTSVIYTSAASISICFSISMSRPGSACFALTYFSIMSSYQPAKSSGSVTSPVLSTVVYFFSEGRGLRGLGTKKVIKRKTCKMRTGQLMLSG